MEKLGFMTFRYSTIFLILALVAITSGKSKYTDETRPYEFGFNIEGEQHRREKKDENGIIMGEFGFITADGVYHVTVYATDENGNFKILKMKNIRLGAAPDVPPPSATPLPELITTTTTTTTTPVPIQADQPFTTAKPLPVASCSHCSIPSTTKKPPPAPPAPVQQQKPQPIPQQQRPQPIPQQQRPQPIPQQQRPVQNEFNESPKPSIGDRFSGFDNGISQNQPGPNDDYQQDQPPKNQYETPLVTSGHLQTVDPAVLNDPPKPGEFDGPPPGVTTDNMSALLYRFNYTVGFHGHYEEGYTNGFKKGEYYVNHRNGMATKISYEADERGYRPKIETVQLSPVETPNPESETNPEFGLKGYEFKWFYVPKYHHLNRY